MGSVWTGAGPEPGRVSRESRESLQHQRRPTGRPLYNREVKPRRHNRDALDSLMIWLGLDPCQRGRQRDIKKTERRL